MCSALSWSAADESGPALTPPTSWTVKVTMSRETKMSAMVGAGMEKSERSGVKYQIMRPRSM